MNKAKRYSPEVRERVIFSPLGCQIPGDKASVSGGFDFEHGRCLIIERAVWSFMVVVMLPGVNDASRCGQIFEPVLVEAAVT